MSNPGTGQPSGIGLFGGTFDPVHFGHLRAALEAKELLNLDDFRLLPAGTPPHRAPPVASAEHRLAMLRLAVAGHPGISVDDRETRRSGNSYMVDTLSEIRRESGDAPLMLLLGQDAANALDTWHEWKTIFQLAHLVIMRRPESVVSWSGELLEWVEPRLLERPERLGEKPAGYVLPIEVTQLAISSTGIRSRLVAGQSPCFLLPDAVVDYITQNRLYFAGAAGKG
ncbi:nicotinate-nucleotide adenylyltransferase [Pseudomonadota bacterium]